MQGGATTDLGLDGSYVAARTPGVVAVDVGGEAVLVDEATSQLHLLNGSGALLWTCFEGDSSLAEICADVADALEVPFEQVLADALALVVDLADRGICYDGREPPPDDRARDTGESVPRPRRLLEEPPSG
jgi:hypothetical protein